MPSFDVIMKHLISVIATIGEQDAFTYNPRTGRMYDITKPGHAGALFDELVAGDKNLRPDSPIHLISVTDNYDISPNDALKWVYGVMMLMAEQPLFGTWINKAGKRCLDLVIQLSQK